MEHKKFSPRDHLAMYPEFVSEHHLERLKDFFKVVYRKEYSEKVTLTSRMLVDFLMPPMSELRDAINLLKLFKGAVDNSLHIKELGGLESGTRVIITNRVGTFEVGKIRDDCYVGLKGMPGAFSPAFLRLA